PRDSLRNISSRRRSSIAVRRPLRGPTGTAARRLLDGLPFAKAGLRRQPAPLEATELLCGDGQPFRRF
ncbi:uncharacterized protein METZ01_LOCUS505149, partial [marine metagenome]